jgi:hypothetical protein
VLLAPSRQLAGKPHRLLNLGVLSDDAAVTVEQFADDPRRAVSL